MQIHDAEERDKAQEVGGGLALAQWESLIPRPSSRFYRVRCISCGGEQIVFSHTSHEIKCRTCGEVLAEPTGGKAKIKGAIVAVLG